MWGKRTGFLLTGCLLAMTIWLCRPMEPVRASEAAGAYEEEAAVVHPDMDMTKADEMADGDETEAGDMVDAEKSAADNMADTGRTETAGSTETAAATEDVASQYTELLLSEYDLSDMDAKLDEFFPELSLNGKELLGMLLEGRVKEVFSLILQTVRGRLYGELPFAREVFIYILILGILSSFFTGFTDLFAGAGGEKLSFYLLYMTLVGILVRVFTLVTQLAQEVLTSVTDFVRIFTPAYFISVGAAGGSGTAVAYYEVMLVAVYFIESGILHIVLPMVYSYMLLGILNGLWAQDRLVLLLELLKKAVGLALKLILLLVTGLGLIQSVILPVVDDLKRSSLHKAVEAIPGIGGVTGGITELLLGAAVLLKNSFGVLLLLVLLGICLMPVLKIGLVAVCVKLAAAVTGIISDKRISECADHVGEGCLMVCRCVFTAVSLFFILIAIIAYSIRS